MMRTTQEIFDVVIDGGFYAIGASTFMCWALDEAVYKGVITEDEHCIAAKEIEVYLDGWFTFETALRRVDLPGRFSDRLAIYRNWVNRPQLIGNKHEQET